MYDHLLAQSFLNCLFVGAYVEGARFLTPSTQLLISSEADSMIGINGLGGINLDSPWTVFDERPKTFPTELRYKECDEEIDLLKRLVGKKIAGFTLFEETQNMYINFECSTVLCMLANEKLFEPWMAGIWRDSQMGSCYIAALSANEYTIAAPENVHIAAGTYTEWLKMQSLDLKK